MKKKTRLRWAAFGDACEVNNLSIFNNFVWWSGQIDDHAALSCTFSSCLSPLSELLLSHSEFHLVIIHQCKSYFLLYFVALQRLLGYWNSSLFRVQMTGVWKADKYLSLLNVYSSPLVPPLAQQCTTTSSSRGESYVNVIDRTLPDLFSDSSPLGCVSPGPIRCLLSEIMPSSRDQQTPASVCVNCTMKSRGTLRSHSPWKQSFLPSARTLETHDRSSRQKVKSLLFEESSWACIIIVIVVDCWESTRDFILLDKNLPLPDDDDGKVSAK